jgi:hypothetical protein
MPFYDLHKELTTRLGQCIIVTVHTICNWGRNPNIRDAETRIYVQSIAERHGALANYTHLDIQTYMQQQDVWYRKQNGRCSPCNI